SYGVPFEQVGVDLVQAGNVHLDIGDGQVDAAERADGLDLVVLGADPFEAGGAGLAPWRRQRAGRGVDRQGDADAHRHVDGAAQLRQAAVGDLVAALHDDDPVDVVGDLGQRVGADQHGGALVAQLAHDVVEHQARGRVQPGGGFVQQQDA